MWDDRGVIIITYRSQFEVWLTSCCVQVAMEAELDYLRLVDFSVTQILRCSMTGCSKIIYDIDSGGLEGGPFSLITVDGEQVLRGEGSDKDIAFYYGW